MPASPPKEDFRSAAAAESEHLLNNLRAQGARLTDPVEAGISYCRKAEEDATAFIRSQRWLATFGLFGSLGAMVVAAILIGYGERSAPAGYKPFFTALSAVFGCGGMLMMTLGVIQSRRRIPRYLRQRRPQWFEGRSNLIVAGLEDTQTYSKLKPIPDDMIVIFLHPESRCAQIEGVSYRYLIYADDVLALKQSSGQNTHAVRIKYRIGQQSLDITIIPSGLWNEFKRQLLGGKGDLHRQLQTVLSGNEVGA